jgi:RNA polymerase sigma factor for flagellar operon FliA
LANSAPQSADPLTICTSLLAPDRDFQFTGNIANAQYFQGLSGTPLPEIVISKPLALPFGIPVAYAGRRRSHQMRSRQRQGKENPRVVAHLPFVEQLARRVAATMPHSIDIGDLVQDGVIGLIDAAHRFDESRGIKFETFAERRIRGAMIDALRKDAWPRGVRRQRRELEAAREQLRRELGCEPSLADLAAKMGSDEKRLGRTIVRINAIESTSPLASGENLDESTLPAALIPSEPEQPDTAYEKSEVKERIRAAIESLPPREQKVIGLYYYQEATMKQIGAEIGVNESRVSQLHARAIRRLRDALAGVMPAAEAAKAMRTAILEFQHKPRMAKATLDSVQPAVVVPMSAGAATKADYPSVSRTARSNSESLNGLASQRQPLSSRKRSASVPATSPVTKMTRRASSGVAAAIAR